MAERKSYKDNQWHSELGRIFSYGLFDLDALLALASHLRDGIPCTAKKNKKPSAGCLNWVVFLTFADGVQWVFRSPKFDAQLSDEAMEKQIASEVATMKYLKNNTVVPVPEVSSFSPTTDNVVGVPYILMSKISGHALDEHRWFKKLAKLQGLKKKRITDKNRKKVMYQLGAMFSGVAEHRFDSIGSLFEERTSDSSPEAPTVGQCLVPHFFWEGRETLEGVPLGPFSSESQYIMAQIRALEEHSRELYFLRPCFLMPPPHLLEYNSMERYQWALRFWAAFAEMKEKEECNNIFVDHCILVHLLKEMVPHIAKTGGETKNNNADSKKGQFVIVHPDLHAGNIFVDDDFNITGILDWSGASTGSLAQLLASVRFKSVHAPQPSLEAAFREGFEKGYIDRKGTDNNRTTYSSGYTLSVAQWEKVKIVEHVDSLARMGIDSGKEHYYNFRQLYKLIYGKQIDDKRIDGSSSTKATDDSKLAIDSNVNQPVNHDTSFTSDGDGSTIGNSIITSDTSMTDICNATADGNTMSMGGSQAIEDSFDCVWDRKVGSIDDNKTGSGQRTEEKISGGYDYDPIISKLFCKHRGMPYAQAELARLNKEDEEAGDKDEGKEEEEEEAALETRCVGLAGAVANKLAVMDSINPNFFPDRRLWKWIGNALAQQMYHDIFEKKKKEGLGSVAAFLEARKKQEAKEALEENGKSRKRARRK